jgi:hypothetical protein
MYHEGTPVRYNPDAAPSTARATAAEESLVSDARAGLTPAQQVERKLVSLLRSTPLPLSQLQTAGPRRSL